MVMVNKEIIVQAFFQDESFEETWMSMKQEYEALGFRDKISDEEMISEYKYISQQLRKYKFSKQDQILAGESYEEMASIVNDLMGKAPEYGDNRKEVVYNFLRDHWLINLFNSLIRIAQIEEEDEDE